MRRALGLLLIFTALAGILAGGVIVGFSPWGDVLCVGSAGVGGLGAWLLEWD